MANHETLRFVPWHLSGSELRSGVGLTIPITTQIYISRPLDPRILRNRTGNPVEDLCIFLEASRGPVLKTQLRCLLTHTGPVATIHLGDLINSADMPQTVFDFVAQVAPAKAADLNALLMQIAQDVRGNPIVPFGRLSSVHFSNMIVFDSSAFGSYLVWEHNVDTNREAYLDELLSNAPGIDQILCCCADYGSADARQYIRRHLVGPNTYHLGTVGRSVDRIRREADLRNRIDSFLDRQTLAYQSPETIRKEIQQFVAAEPALTWAKQIEIQMTFSERMMPYLKIASLIFILLIVAVAITSVTWWFIPAALVVVLLVLRWHERHDQPSAETVSSDHIRQLLASENSAAQNHLASVTVVKAGFFRGLVLRLVLFVANLIARVSTKGELARIPTIHFAHWSLIDGGRRLLFLSNYDGSWGSYLDDFIDKVSFGLTGIWSNTVGFPRSKFLILAGARDGPRFKSFARASQSLTRVQYCAYPNLTVRNINDNSRLREGLYGSVEAREWLRFL